MVSSANLRILFGRVGMPEDIYKLRADLVKFGDWFKEWLMFFDVDKCKVMRVGYGTGMKCMAQGCTKSWRN